MKRFHLILTFVLIALVGALAWWNMSLRKRASYVEIVPSVRTDTVYAARKEPRQDVSPTKPATIIKYLPADTVRLVERSFKLPERFTKIPPMVSAADPIVLTPRTVEWTYFNPQRQAFERALYDMPVQKWNLRADVNLSPLGTYGSALLTHTRKVGPATMTLGVGPTYDFASGDLGAGVHVGVKFPLRKPW